MRSDIISYCSELFDLNDNSEVIIFNRWLARLGDYEKVLQYLPASKAKVDEELFKLRMNALAQVNDLERIHEEINNVPIIPSRWRLVVEARAHAMNGNFKDAAKSLDRLLPILGDDPRQVRSVCHYLESANDLKNLSHILRSTHRQTHTQPIRARKLLQHRSASASLSELILWLSQLSKSDRTNKSFEISLLYLRLLDPSLPSPSKELTGLVAEAQKRISLFQLEPNPNHPCFGSSKKSIPGSSLSCSRRTEQLAQMVEFSYSLGVYCFSNLPSQS